MRVRSDELAIVYSNQGRLMELSGDERISYVEWTKHLNREWRKSAQDEVARLRANQVEKPTWFVSAERSARGFIAGLGLTAAKGCHVSLVDIVSSEQENAVSMNQDPQLRWDAYHSRHYGIVFRKEAAMASYEKWGKLGIGKLLAHELTHAAQGVSPVVYYNWNGDGWDSLYRQGLSLNACEQEYGRFFTEGIPEFNAGLYVRRMLHGRNTPLIPQDSLSNGKQLPEHFRNYNVPKQQITLAGPDGYSIELLAAGAEKMGIVPASTFMQSAYDTYSPDAHTRLLGHRNFARTLDAIRPGLYKELRDLQHGLADWQVGLAAVRSAVELQ